MLQKAGHRKFAFVVACRRESESGVKARCSRMKSSRREGPIK